MDVADAFQEVRLSLAEDGLVAVLEKMARSVILLVFGNSVAGQESPHESCYRGSSGANQDMDMIG